MALPLFAPQLETSPDQLAITDLSRQLSWSELAHRVTALVTYMRDQLGLVPGDAIVLAIGNRVEHVELMLAGQLAGCWVTPLNTHLSQREMDYIRNDCGARVVFCDDEREPLLMPGSAGQVINLRALTRLPDGATLTADAPCGGAMLYTSGTTGLPKGVRRAKPDNTGQWLKRTATLGRAFGLCGDGPHLVTGPLYHAAPGMFALYDLINGAPMVIMPRWDTRLFIDCVQQYGISTTHLVPTMFVRLLQQAEQPTLPSLKLVLHGAAPIAPSIKQRMIAWWGPILTEYWGGTESGTVTLVDSVDWQRHPGTVGRPVASYEVFVGDAQGNPTGETEGLLFCRHRELSEVFHYHNDPDKTARAHPRPYTVSLGDIGRIDDEGFVYLLDRESHMIISGGVNIYPQEVEQVLVAHPLVADAAVFGIPNEEWGEEVRAVVQPSQPQALQEELSATLREFLRGEIAHYKVPRVIETVDEVPRNAAGKVLVRELKARYQHPL